MSRSRRFFLIALLLVLVSQPSSAYYNFLIGSADLHWTFPNVSYVLQTAGSDNIADDSEFLAIERAFDAWENLPNSSIAFVEDLAADPTRTDYSATDIHLIMFDEDDSTGLFPGASGTIAVTPILFDTVSGSILDADIIFNGDDHTFSTDGSPGTYDIQSIATHEIGHLLGLDHSGSCASTMFPFAESGRTVARSLTLDDIAGAESIYPNGGTVASISGTINRSGGGVAVGAHVVAINDDGVVVATTYSQLDGSFVIERLPIDVYELYAEPLDEPVTGGNLSSSIGAAVEDDFATTYWGGNPSPSSLLVSGGTNHAIGTITVPTAISKSLTLSGDYPYLGTRGSSTTVMALGPSIDPGDVPTISGAGVTVDSYTYLNLGPVRGFLIDITVSPTAVLGPRNVRLDTTGGEVLILTGALEVVDPAPTISVVAPTTGTTTGGEVVTITGSGYQSDAEVIFGDTLAATVTVDSSNQITVTTPAGLTGAVDVIVENGDGQLDVQGSAFQFIAQPTVSTVFPNAGAAAGGSTAYLTGTNFVSGLTVTVGGFSAAVVSVQSTVVEITTPAGVAGSADIVVTNPGGLLTTVVNGFTYVVANDPQITTLTPATGPSSGGTEIVVDGADFDAAVTVTFDQSVSGSGGTSAATLEWVDSTQLVITSPTLSVGNVAITIQNPDGTTHYLPAAFTVTAVAGGGGGGGGGCMAIAPLSRPNSNRCGGGGGSGGFLYALLGMLVVFRRRVAELMTPREPIPIRVEPVDRRPQRRGR